MKPKPRGDYTVTGLSRILGCDRKTIDKVLVSIKPSRVCQGRNYWRLEDVQAAFDKRPDKNLREQKLSEEIRKLRIKNDRDEGKLILKTDVATAVRRILGRLAPLLESKLVNEYPSLVHGQDVAAIRIYGRQLHDLLMCEYQKLAMEWPE